MIDEYLTRFTRETPTIDVVVAQGREKTSGDIEFVNWIGKQLIRRFWISEPEFADAADLRDTPDKNGVYFNGKNSAEFLEQVRSGNILFWKQYAKKTGISDPESLLERWLDISGRSGYNFERTPEEIFNQQYLGKGGGCGEYVAVMTDILRAAGIPTKVIFFLKHNENCDKDDITKIVDGIQGRYGHYMGACDIDSTWRLFDFKWQWNPHFSDFYLGSEQGLTTLNHRNGDGTIYVAVTNNAIYTLDEPLSSPNIGMIFPKDLPEGKVDIERFAYDYKEKSEKAV